MIKLSPPTNNPIVDSRGILRNDWAIWFNELYKRVGGSTSLSNNDLAGKVVENTGAIVSNRDKINLAENEINDIQEDIIDIKIDIEGVNFILAGIQTAIDSKISTIANVGGGTGLYRNKTGTQANLKTLKSSNLVKLSSDDNNVTISSKTINGGSNVTVTENETSVTISATIPAQKSIVAGSNITVTEDATSFTIANKNLYVFWADFRSTPGDIVIDISSLNLDYNKCRVHHIATAVCTSAELGYSVGDEVDYITSDGVFQGKPYTVTQNAITLSQLSLTGVVNKANFTYAVINPTKWRIFVKVYVNYA